MKLEQFLIQESINDKALFKAVFMGGMPGVGKSSIIKRLESGWRGAKLVDPDKHAEFKMEKNPKFDPRGDMERGYMKGKVVKEMVNYVNGMLPMYIATTGAKYDSTIRRIDLLESFGYDTAMVFVSSDFWDVLANIAARKRPVDDSFIDLAFENMEGHMLSYKRYFGKNFYIHKNTFMRPSEVEELVELSNNKEKLEGLDLARYEQLMEKAKKAQESEMALPELAGIVDKFFKEPIRNQRGRSTVDYLKRTGGKYLTDGVMDLDAIQRVLSKW